MADFGLLDRQVVDTVLQFREESLFLRGLFQWVGFPSSKILYQCQDRFSGMSKYTMKKMIKFAFAGITSFSVVPPAAVTPIVYDNFDDNLTNPSLWSIEQQGGPVAAEMKQRLEITLPANSEGVKFDAGCNSVCQLRGDFDIQVDYELLTWPIRNGVRISLNTVHGNIERVSFGSSPPDFAGGPEVYLTDFSGLVKGITSTSDFSGKLRLERVGATLTGYYFVNGGWVP